MTILSKCSAFLLFLLLVCSSLVLNGSVYASTAKPTVPEFTLKYADYSYTAPPTYGVDPYTGKSTTLTPSYEIVNRTVTFTVKNQPFTPYTDSSGNPVDLFYHIRYKGNYGDTWSGNSQMLDGRTIIYDTLVSPASDSAYSELSVVRYSDGCSDYKPLNYVPLPDGGSVDFQVQAIIGTANLETLKTTWSNVGPFYTVTGQIGDWSSTQTITINGNNPGTTTSVSLSPSLFPPESQNPTPTQPVTQTIVQQNNDWVQLAIVALLGAVAALLAVTVALQLKKRKQSPESIDLEK